MKKLPVELFVTQSQKPLLVFGAAPAPRSPSFFVLAGSHANPRQLRWLNMLYMSMQ